MRIENFLRRLERVRHSGAGWMARCPAHEDRSPSLSVAEGTDERIMVHCFAGCSASEIMEVVGFTLRDLFAGKAQDQRRPKPRRHLKEAQLIAIWAATMGDTIRARMREVGNRAHLAREVSRMEYGDKKLMSEEIKQDSIEWGILSVLDEDLANPDHILALWSQRKDVDRLVENMATVDTEQPEAIFPPLTDAYRRRLVSCVGRER